MIKEKSENKVKIRYSVGERNVPCKFEDYLKIDFQDRMTIRILVCYLFPFSTHIASICWLEFFPPEISKKTTTQRFCNAKKVQFNEDAILIWILKTREVHFFHLDCKGVLYQNKSLFKVMFSHYGVP